MLFIILKIMLIHILERMHLKQKTTMDKQLFGHLLVMKKKFKMNLIKQFLVLKKFKKFDKFKNMYYNSY